MSSRHKSADGDWTCADQKCNNVNFARRSSCNRCGKEREPFIDSKKNKQSVEIGKAAAEKSHGLFSADDWQCSKCGNVNWARRNTCNMCNAPKVGEVEERTGYGGGFNERDGVEYIKREDSDDEYDEFGFRKKKFRGAVIPPAVTAKPVSPPKVVVEENKEENDEEDDEEDDEDEDVDLSKYDLWGDEDEEEEQKEKQHGTCEPSSVSKIKDRNSSNSPPLHPSILKSKSQSKSRSRSRSHSRSSQSSRSRSSTREHSRSSDSRSRSPYPKAHRIDRSRSREDGRKKRSFNSNSSYSSKSRSRSRSRSFSKDKRMKR